MYKHRNNALDGGAGEQPQPDASQQVSTMEMPLFPLNHVVLFPRMVLPLHIFEPRYREMINRCIDERLQFGVVLIDEGQEVDGGARPHLVGTAARIARVDRLDDGRMNITTIGTQRFRILKLDYSRSYLSATVAPHPVINGSTKNAFELARRMTPRVVEYIDLLSAASNTKLQHANLPDDPAMLAFLVGMSLQVGHDQKQKLLELPGIPEMLQFEVNLLAREILFTRHMLETQSEIMAMNSGPTGYIFPN